MPGRLPVFKYACQLKVAFVLVLCTSACASFYELNYEFNRRFEQGQLQQAADVLSSTEAKKYGKTRFLYYANQGMVNHLLGNYKQSNEWFEKAYLFGEDYQKSYLNFAASYFLNPNLIVYPGEEHEHLMLLYYKVLNYLKMNDYDAALVECRRLDNRLYTLDDKFRSENKYSKDAFVHNLMGIIYEASGDYNNAFIAYRNALKIYEEDYARLFAVRVPKQLKEDLMRAAYLAGFRDELIDYEKKFGYAYEHEVPEGGFLVFFWHNGLIPVKEQWSISFIADGGRNGQVFFQNEELGLDFSFPYDPESSGASIAELSGTRVAFPKYREREPYFNYADLEVNGDYYTLEKTEDLNAIAFKLLNQRMLEELGKGLLRVALKKAVEKQVRKEDETLGFIVSAINFSSEQADTRNWQTLPHSIHYTRVPLKRGKNMVELYSEGERSEATRSFQFEGEKGETQFHMYHSLESEIGY